MTHRKAISVGAPKCYFNSFHIFGLGTLTKFFGVEQPIGPGLHHTILPHPSQSSQVLAQIWPLQPTLVMLELPHLSRPLCCPVKHVYTLGNRHLFIRQGSGHMPCLYCTVFFWNRRRSADILPGLNIVARVSETMPGYGRLALSHGCLLPLYICPCPPDPQKNRHLEPTKQVRRT